MKTCSIWEDEKDNVNKSLNKDIDIDILIIGGGITGLSIAYHLKDAGLKIALVERNTIGKGVTGKTTGKLTYFQENYDHLLKYHGLNKAKLYYESQVDAINMVKNIIEKENINCDLEKAYSILENNENQKFKKAIKALKKIGVPFKHKGNLLIAQNTYTFHPIKYLYSLKKICNDKLQIYENTKIINIKKNQNNYICKTKCNLIKTKKVVLACHYPYFLFPFPLFLKSKIETSYMAAYKTNSPQNFSSITIKAPSVSQRFFTNKYHIVLKSSVAKAKENTEIKADLLSKKPDYFWSNNDLCTYDYLPFIGEIKNNLYIATGFNTWGMTNGSLSGKIIADNILNKENKYSNLFNPKRNINFGKIINTPIILLTSSFLFFKSKLVSKNSNVVYEKKNGKNVATYTDENNIKHKVFTTCPHLKCTLLFNSIEKTWDCPCHGSRFDIDGNAIKGPSNYNITYKE